MSNSWLVLSKFQIGCVFLRNIFGTMNIYWNEKQRQYQDLSQWCATEGHYLIILESLLTIGNIIKRNNIAFYFLKSVSLHGWYQKFCHQAIMEKIALRLKNNRECKFQKSYWRHKSGLFDNSTVCLAPQVYSALLSTIIKSVKKIIALCFGGVLLRGNVFGKISDGSKAFHVVTFTCEP